MKKIIITGAAGFIGSHLVKSFITGNNYLYLIDKIKFKDAKNLAFLKKYKNYKYTAVNLSKINKSFFKKFKKIDMIIHCASIIGVNKVNDPFLVHDQITGVSQKIIDFYKKKKILFAYFSSSEIYGDQNNYNEKSGTRIYGFNTTQNLKDVRWVYGESKFFIETCLRFINRNNKNFRFLIFRPFNFFGPNQANNFVIPKMINDLKKNNKIQIFDNKNITRTFTYIDDAINIIRRLINKKESHNESYNVGSKNTIKTYDLGKKIIKKFQKINKQKKYAINLDRNVKDPIQERKPKLNRIKLMLKNIKYTNFDKALDETIDYYNNKKY